MTKIIRPDDINGIPENYEEHRRYEEDEARNDIVTMFGIYAFLALFIGWISSLYWMAIIICGISFLMAGPVIRGNETINTIKTERAILKDRAMERMMFNDED